MKRIFDEKISRSKYSNLSNNNAKRRCLTINEVLLMEVT